MAARTAVFLACALLTISSACGRGKMGIVIDALDDVDTAELTRLHVHVTESELVGGKWTYSYWDANIDRGAGHWDGNLPVQLIYDGYLPSAVEARYYVEVAGYAGDQITAKSGGQQYVTGVFSNVERVVKVILIAHLGTF
jgi:hypothetical protein